MTPFRAVVVPVAARLTVNCERDDVSPSLQAGPTEPPVSYFSCLEESELNYAAGFPGSVRTGARVQRVNGTEVAEFRAMELSLGRPGNSLNEGIAGPHGSAVFVSLDCPVFDRKIVTVI